MKGIEGIKYKRKIFQTVKELCKAMKGLEEIKYKRKIFQTVKKLCKEGFKTLLRNSRPSKQGRWRNFVK
jgi:hypothetical protein